MKGGGKTRVKTLGTGGFTTLILFEDRTRL